MCFGVSGKSSPITRLPPASAPVPSVLQGLALGVDGAEGYGVRAGLLISCRPFVTSISSWIEISAVEKRMKSRVRRWFQ